MKTNHRPAKAGNYARGERSPRAKLTDAKVAVILSRLADGVTKQRIAQDHHVSWLTIDNLQKRRTWRHVPVPHNWPKHWPKD